ncbi:MAG TPA: acetate uptake transporter [Ktedonobacteraceae bacterium]|nr:acetate uptake transporter [Ktedonobacteraceae bacterium]
MAQIAAEHTEAAASAHANPAPLGLSGFAVTTFLLSIVNAGIIVKTDANFLGLALGFGGLAQLLAGMWEFRAGNTLGATAFSSYGAFWLSVAVGVLTKTFGGDGVSYYFLAWAILTFVFLLSALRTNGALIAVFLFLTLTFLALAFGAFMTSTTWTGIGGWLGIITAILAEYTALAGLLSSGKSAFQLPTWPRS